MRTGERSRKFAPVFAGGKGYFGQRFAAVGNDHVAATVAAQSYGYVLCAVGREVFEAAHRAPPEVGYVLVRLNFAVVAVLRFLRFGTPE